ncbi:MAG: YfhO family protein [Solobacterium sp.]|nr:YfhO family protein [Solobacterium sp.]
MSAEKSRLSAFLEEYGILLLVTLAFGVILFFPTLSGSRSFAWFNDQQYENNIFYIEYYEIVRDCLKSRSLALYSWNTFLGSDFFVSHLMYTSGDFLLPLVVFIYHFTKNIDLAMAVETILCLMISAAAMNLYLRKILIKDRTLRHSISLIYAFSGAAAIFSGSYMFHRFYALLPLLFTAIENWYRERKLAMIPVVTAVLFLQCFELLFSLSFFLLLYVWVTSRVHGGKTSAADIVRSALPPAAAYIAGMFLAGIALIPLILFLHSNPRIGEMGAGGLLWDLRSTAGLFYSLLAAPLNFRSDTPHFLFYGDHHFGSEFSIYASCLPLLALLQGGTDRKNMRVWTAGEIIIFLCLLVRPLNSVIHAFSEPTFRWSYFLVFYNLWMCAEVFADGDVKPAGRKLFLLFGAYALLFAGFCVVYAIPGKDAVWTWLLLGLHLAVTLAADFCLKNQRKESGWMLAAAFTMITYGITVFVPYHSYPDAKKPMNREYINYFRENDADLMYRMHIPSTDVYPFSPLNKNLSQQFNYMSTEAYFSTFDNNIAPFLAENGYVSNIIFDINRPDHMRMLGVKYIGALDESELPPELSFTYAYSLDDLKVYQIDNYLHIGHTYSRFVSELGDISDYCEELYVPAEAQADLSGITAHEKNQLTVTAFSHRGLTGTITVPQKCVLFMGFPNSSGWQVYDRDGRQLETFDVQGGFLGLVLEPGEHVLTFTFTPPGIRAGALLSGIVLAAVLYGLYRETRRR